MKFKNNRLKKASLNHTALTTNMNPFSNTIKKLEPKSGTATDVYFVKTETNTGYSSEDFYTSAAAFPAIYRREKRRNC